MSNGGLILLDGSQLSPDWTTPLPDCITGAEILDLAHSNISERHLGVAFPDNRKSLAFSRLGVPNDLSSFCDMEFDRDAASSLLRRYVHAMADELKDDPVFVAILDGRNLGLILADEDDFAMFAEDLFTDIDTEDNGKIGKNEMHNALLHMGIQLGIPPLSVFPQLSAIINKHIAKGDEEVGQAQFADLLQPILQELVDVLARKHIVVIQNINIANGSKIKKLLADAELLDFAKKIMLKQDTENNKTSKEIIRAFLEENGKELGLPPLRADDMVVLLYDTVFEAIGDMKNAVSEENLALVLKEILEKFQEQLEANPLFYDA